MNIQRVTKTHEFPYIDTSLAAFDAANEALVLSVSSTEFGLTKPESLSARDQAVDDDDITIFKLRLAGLRHEARPLAGRNLIVQNSLLIGMRSAYVGEGRVMHGHFGENVMVDGYGGDPKLLDDSNLVERAISELTGLLEMTPLCPVSVFWAPDNHLKDPGGWSGFVVLAESHISLHTFPRRRFLSADAYTCRAALDVGIVERFLRSKFRLEALETNHVRRGLRYPMRNVS